MEVTIFQRKLMYQEIGELFFGFWESLTLRGLLLACDFQNEFKMGSEKLEILLCLEYWREISLHCAHCMLNIVAYLLCHNS